ncbi:hypothetical protein [Actinoplanes sp. NPDC026623]
MDRREGCPVLKRLEIGLLAVEDVHWADEATLEFLLFWHHVSDNRSVCW